MKTTCKWRNTDYVVERKDVKPDNISTDDDWKTMPLKRGDNVKVKYGNRWYKAQVEEIGENSRKDGTSYARFAMNTHPYYVIIELKLKRIPRNDMLRGQLLLYCFSLIPHSLHSCRSIKWGRARSCPL